MKKYLLALLVVLFLAPQVPSAGAQVVVAVGNGGGYHHRHYRHHHHRHYRHR